MLKQLDTAADDTMQEFVQLKVSTAQRLEKIKQEKEQLERAKAKLNEEKRIKAIKKLLFYEKKVDEWNKKVNSLYSSTSTTLTALENSDEESDVDSDEDLDEDLDVDSDEDLDEDSDEDSEEDKHEDSVEADVDSEEDSDEDSDEEEEEEDIDLSITHGDIMIQPECTYGKKCTGLKANTCGYNHKKLPLTLIPKGSTWPSWLCPNDRPIPPELKKFHLNKRCTDIACKLIHTKGRQKWMWTQKTKMSQPIDLATLVQGD